MLLNIAYITVAIEYIIINYNNLGNYTNSIAVCYKFADSDILELTPQKHY